MPKRAPHIFLASRTEQENQILRHKLESLRKDYRNLGFSSVHHQGLIASMDQPAALVVLNHVDFGDKQQADFELLRASGYRGQVLVISKTHSLGIKDYLQAQKNTVLLEKPFEPRDFEGIVRKVLNERAISQRVHRRYNTAQECEISPFGKNATYQSKVCNLSVGGAYLEFTAPPQIAEGELVRMRFDLVEMNRTYTMPARVVWARKMAATTGIHPVAYGVEFIGPGDVVNNLVLL